MEHYIKAAPNGDKLRLVTEVKKAVRQAHKAKKTVYHDSRLCIKGYTADYYKDSEGKKDENYPNMKTVNSPKAVPVQKKTEDSPSATGLDKFNVEINKNPPRMNSTVQYTGKGSFLVKTSLKPPAPPPKSYKTIFLLCDTRTLT